jgi:serine/threonine protein kinase
MSKKRVARAPGSPAGARGAERADLPPEAHAFAGLGPHCAALIAEYAASRPQLLIDSQLRPLQPISDALYRWDPEKGRDSEAANLIKAVLDRIESEPVDVVSLRGWILSHPNDAGSVIECMNTLPPPGMKIIRLLSRKGSQKVVFLATWQLALRQVVLKRLLGPPTEAIRIQARESRTNPLATPCGNIAHTYAAQNSRDEVFVVEEYLPVILSDTWRAPGLAEAANLLYDITCAIACLHSQVHLVHGDVKPDNIGKDGSSYLLLDFGICRPAAEFTGEVTGTGSLRTRAPELLLSDAYGADAEAVKKVDVWALGATVFNSILGRFPLLEPGEYVPRVDEVEARRAFEATLKLRVEVEWDKRVDLSPISEPLRSVLGGALRRDPSERLSSTDLMRRTEQDLAAYLRANSAASDPGRFSPLEELDQYRDHLMRDTQSVAFMPASVRDQLKQNLSRLREMQGFGIEEHSEIDSLIEKLG